MTELERLVHLVPYLKSHQGVTVEELAETFGITPARVLADLRVLQFVGLPGGYYGDLFEVDINGAREHGDVFVRNVDALGRPMRLTHDQVASLLVVLQVVIDMGGDDPAARSALAKLQALSLDAPPPVDVELQSGDTAVRAALTRALESRLAVLLAYRPGGRVPQRRAVVEPARLRTDAGFGYLDAWSRARAAWRTYRLDRVDDVTVLDEQVTPRDIPEQLDTWFGDVQHTLSVVVTDGGRWCADYYPTTEVREVDDGTEITFPLVSDDWGARLLLRLGDDVVRVSDPAVLARARALAGAALDHYGEAP
ncbi:MAG: WYL domain-containing protein [Propionibacterium sp.]|nr:WYL domain-containing protein [Propionibacterium sp.]